MHTSTLVALGLALLAIGVPDAAGQGDTGPRLTTTVGAALGGGDAATSVSVGVGYRFSMLFTVDAEVAFVPSLDRARGTGDAPGQMGMDGGRIVAAAPDPIPGYHFDVDTYLLTFMSTLSIEVPTTVRWLHVFGLGGLGVASYSERLAVSFGPMGVPSYDLFETGLLLAVGAGTDVDVWKGLAIGGEVRYFHVYADRRDLDVTRVAGRVGWRF